MKKFIILITTFLFLISTFNICVYAKTSPPRVEADGAILMDAATGKILYSKNINTAYPPASTTKILTALLTLEKCKLTDVVTVGYNPPRVDGNRIGIMEGEKLTVKDLLYGLILLSGNDCAEALAEHVGGSLDGFSVMMNEKAKELGAANTNFVNPSGLYNPNHKSSALDMALILKELSKNQDFITIATTLSYKTEATTQHPNGIELYNENKMICKDSKFYYDGAQIGKNGYTVDSLHSYVATAKRGNQELILILLHSANKANGYYQHYIDAAAVLNYGFDNFDLVQLYKKDDVVSTCKLSKTTEPLLAAEDYFYVREKGCTDTPTMNLANNSIGNTPFSKGDVISSADFSFNGEKLTPLKLVSGTDYKLSKNVKNVKVASEINKNTNHSSLNFIKFIFGFILLSVALFILGRIYIKTKNRKRTKYNLE
ncbi:MAG: D-alanyl-D-alanine carboxypeptidase family protein [Bacillota bacterium]|nr:D-alanyl-D-alanine carboxypeptidase family protein [Bacillota bacterium]